MSISQLHSHGYCTYCTIPSGAVFITPKMAAHWLAEHLGPNRVPSATTVKRYAEAMRAGRWVLTHQGGAFDEQDLILDGQHRFMAIVESGVTVQMMIATGCPRETFALIDIQRKRAASQFVTGKHATLIAAAARIIGPVTGAFASNDVRGGIYDGAVENDQILNLIEAWPELAAFAPEANRCYRTTTISASPHLAILAMASRTRYGTEIDGWLQGLIEGVNLGDGDARRHLTKKYSSVRDRRMYTSSSRSGRTAAYHIICKAWNAHALHKPISLLRYSEIESVPKIVS
jgi:hypothetical protein